MKMNMLGCTIPFKHRDGGTYVQAGPTGGDTGWFLMPFDTPEQKEFVKRFIDFVNSHPAINLPDYRRVYQLDVQKGTVKTFWERKI